MSQSTLNTFSTLLVLNLTISVSLVNPDQVGALRSTQDNVQPNLYSGKIPLTLSLSQNEEKGGSLEDILDGLEKTTQNSEIKERFLPLTSQCGYRNKDDVGFRLDESTYESKYGEFPWMIGIYIDNVTIDGTSREFKCSGSLIHPKVVVATAHCILDTFIDDISVRAGDWDLKTNQELFPHQDLRIKNVIIHENYSMNSMNDIALLIVEKEFDLNENVNVICLPDFNSKENEFQLCISSGWKREIDSNSEPLTSNILQKSELITINKDSCEMELRNSSSNKFDLDKSYVCTKQNSNAKTCNWAEGFSLACPINTEQNYYYLSGIAVSQGICNNELPNVFSSISHLKSWINKKFNENNIVFM